MSKLNAQADVPKADGSCVYTEENLSFGLTSLKRKYARDLTEIKRGTVLAARTVTLTALLSATITCRVLL